MRTPCVIIILYHTFYLSSKYTVITVYFVFSCCLTLSRRPVTAAAVPTYLSNHLPTFQSNYLRSTPHMCPPYDLMHGNSGRHRLLNRS